jgi:phosphate transport system protein
MVEALQLEEHVRRDMENLRKQVRRMADLVLTGLRASIAALVDRNRKAAYQVILADHRIDVLEGHIDRLCQEFLIRHIPVAAQLRFVVAVAKANSEIERIGDYAEGIARRAVTMSTTEGELIERDHLREMAELATKMLDQAVDAFLRGDVELARATLELDAKVNQLHKTVYAHLSHAREGERDLSTRFVLFGVASRLERVADRACNIAEEVIYVVRGEVLRHLPRHDLRVVFISHDNSCRSQMAEAIARSLAPGHLLFTSAGTVAGTLDPGAVKYLATRGIDMARARAKTLDDVGPLDDYNVVVTLSHEAEEQCPPVPYKAVALNWELADPSRVQGDAATAEKAYADVYAELDAKIRELIESLVGAHADREEDE